MTINILEQLIYHNQGSYLLDVVHCLDILKEVGIKVSIWILLKISIFYKHILGLQLYFVENIISFNICDWFLLYYLYFSLHDKLKSWPIAFIKIASMEHNFGQLTSIWQLSYLLNKVLYKLIYSIWFIPNILDTFIFSITSHYSFASFRTWSKPMWIFKIK